MCRFARARRRARRGLFAAIAVATTATGFAPDTLLRSEPAAAAEPIAAVVVGNPSKLTRSDYATIARVDRRFAIGIVDDGAPVAATLPDLVVLARSVTAGTGRRYRGATTGVVALDAQAWQGLRLTSSARRHHHVRTSRITIVAGKHPIAGRAEGERTVARRRIRVDYVRRGNLGDGVVSVARLVKPQPRRSVVLVANDGAALTTGRAADRRVGFGLVVGGGLNRTGWALFDQALVWAARVGPKDPPPPPPSDACDASTERLCVDPGRGLVRREADVAMVLNGVNLQDAVESDWHYDLAPIAVSGSPDFNSIRIAMNWPIFEPSSGSYPAATWTRLDELIAQADALGYEVVLDPIHLRRQRFSVWEVHPGSTWNAPDWAWVATGIAYPARYGLEPQPAYNCGVEDLLRATALPYLRHVTERYADNPAVVAIDLVNEPRNSCWGADGEAPTAQASAQELLDLQLDWVDDLRTIDTDKIFVIEPMYGDFDPNMVDLSGFAGRSNLMWTVHDYYAGRGPAYRSNGLADESSERANLCETTCYNPATEPRANRVAAMRAVLERHEDALDTFGVPVLIGEYGFHLQATHLVAAFEDKFTIYDDAGVSRLAWIANFDTPGFALFHEGTQSWDAGAVLLTGGERR